MTFCSNFVLHNNSEVSVTFKVLRRYDRAKARQIFFRNARYFLLRSYREFHSERGEGIKPQVYPIGPSCQPNQVHRALVLIEVGNLIVVGGLLIQEAISFGRYMWSIVV